MLDTNAVSETRKPEPNPGLMAWRNAQERARLFIKTITLGEAWLGLHRLPPNHSDYEDIKRFVANLPIAYRVLKFDLRAAAIRGELTAKANGPLPMRDSFITSNRPLARLPRRYPRRGTIRAHGLQSPQSLAVRAGRPSAGVIPRHFRPGFFFPTRGERALGGRHRLLRNTCPPRIARPQPAETQARVR